MPRDMRNGFTRTSHEGTKPPEATQRTLRLQGCPGGPRQSALLPAPPLAHWRPGLPAIGTPSRTALRTIDYERAPVGERRINLSPRGNSTRGAGHLPLGCRGPARSIESRKAWRCAVSAMFPRLRFPGTAPAAATSTPSTPCRYIAVAIRPQLFPRCNNDRQLVSLPALRGGVKCERGFPTPRTNPPSRPRVLANRHADILAILDPHALGGERRFDAGSTRARHSTAVNP